jgi:lipopolysaccharide export system permease protein
MIWQRLIFRELLKNFALVLFGFFFLYCALDYSFHMQDFLKGKGIRIVDFGLYYTHLFIKRSDLLIPLGVLVATIKVLTTLNTQRELLALQVAGLNFKKINKPFLLLAACCALFTLISTECILPHSTIYLDNFHNSHFSHSNQGVRALAKKEKLQVIPLPDRSKVVYQYFDKEKEAYFDLIWIRTPDDIWRMKYLKMNGKHPMGEYADHFVRGKNGFFEKVTSHVEYEFTPLKGMRESSVNAFIPYENRKASELIRLGHRSTTTAYEKAEIMTNFHSKIAMPFLPLLVVMAASPFCVRYSRTQSPFFTYVFGIFGYITFYLITNACFILGESNALSPGIAIYTPFLVCGSYFSLKFFKTI